MGGDFNADADQIMSAQGMSPGFVDSWATVGGGSGFTFPVPSPTMKLDYLLFDSSWAAQPLSSAVVTSTGSTSDHYPMRTTFRIHSAFESPFIRPLLGSELRVGCRRNVAGP